jgi:hypothetical protein
VSKKIIADSEAELFTDRVKNPLREFLWLCALNLFKKVFSAVINNIGLDAFLRQVPMALLSIELSSVRLSGNWKPSMMKQTTDFKDIFQNAMVGIQMYNGRWRIALGVV